jgi:hypothetical protein
MASPPDASLLAGVWKQLREMHPEIPDATITVTHNKRSSSCTGINWQSVPVIELSADTTLRRPAVQILEYLLHHAAHGIAGPSRGDEGRYHSAVYREAARGLGLDVSEAATGWSVTHLSRSALAEYGAAAQALSDGLRAWRRTKPEPGVRPTSRSPVAAWCSCPEPRRVGVSPSVAERGPIRCDVCSQPFVIGPRPAR